MAPRGFLVFLLIAILHYTICHGFFNRGDGQGSSGIAGFGTRSGYMGAGRWWCTCRQWWCRPGEWRVRNKCGLPFYPWWWKTCCKWLPWWKTTSGGRGFGTGLQDGRMGINGFDPSDSASGIAGFGTGRGDMGFNRYFSRRQKNY